MFLTTSFLEALVAFYYNVKMSTVHNNRCMVGLLEMAALMLVTVVVNCSHEWWTRAIKSLIIQIQHTWWSTVICLHPPRHQSSHNKTKLLPLFCIQVFVLQRLQTLVNNLLHVHTQIETIQDIFQKYMFRLYWSNPGIITSPYECKHTTLIHTMKLHNLNWLLNRKSH